MKLLIYGGHEDEIKGLADKCGGMMEPFKIDFEKGKYFINHRCLKCGFIKRKSLEKNDDFDSAILIVEKSTK